MIQIGDKVKVGKSLLSGTVTDIIPGVAMYRILFDDAVTHNEKWVDEGMVYGPFIDQNIGWNN